MMRIVLYFLILAFVLRTHHPVYAQSPLPPPPADFDDEDDEDEEDIDEPPAMRPPPMPSPFNQANPNAGGPPPPTSPGNTRPSGPDFSNNRFGGGANVGSAVGTVMANPSKVKFKVVEGEFYQKGKKRGRDKIK